MHPPTLRPIAYSINVLSKFCADLDYPWRYRQFATSNVPYCAQKIKIRAVAARSLERISSRREAWQILIHPGLALRRGNCAGN